MVAGYKTEKNFLDKVETCLKGCGCDTWREVIPDNCKSWGMPYRVDLIFYRKDFGYIGVEGKNLNSLRTGTKFSQAIDQINDKYRNQTYFNGNMINRWCIVAPMNVDWISKEGQELTKQFIKNFLRTRYKISLMEYVEGDKRYHWADSISIDTNSKNSLYLRRDKL